MQAFAAIVQFNESQVWDVMTYFYTNQAQFYNSVFYTKTEEQLINVFAGFAANFGINFKDFNTSYNSEGTFISFLLFYSYVVR